MKFFEGLFNTAALVLIVWASVEIINLDDYSPINLFILGMCAAIFAQTIKQTNDSIARNKFEKSQS